MGTSMNDVLRGGHGEDRLEGGDGNDWLVSYADSREPVIAQNYNADDDPNSEISHLIQKYDGKPLREELGTGAKVFYIRRYTPERRT